MSLFDSLLLEGYRDPRDVYIALRTDGQKGSGTIDDPYDGSRRNYASIGVSSLSNSGGWATVVTSSNHGFASGDMVTINGVGTANGADIYYSGTFPIVWLSNTSFKYQIRGLPKLASAPGTITCVRERELFDSVMRGLSANSIIHLGPGIFESKGTTGAVPSWEPKSGQRIVGAGWGATTLKLINASWPELDYALIRPSFYATFIEDFEVSDLTFDCNIAGQPNQLLSCTAIHIKGKHVRLRRLRAINFSSQATGYVENFVISVGAAHQESGKEGVDCVIEDCIAEQPGLNAANNSSVFSLINGETPHDGFMAWHRAFAIRRTWYDGTFLDRPVPIASITIAGGVATVTTRVPHGRNNGDSVVIAGAVENGSLRSAYNGTYPIANVSASQFTYTPAAYDGLSVPTTNPIGDMWVDRFSSHRVPIASLAQDPGDSTVAILTSYGPHNRKPGQWVRVFARTDSTPAGAAAFYGRFPIKDGSISSPCVLKYQMNAAPTEPAVQSVLGVANLSLGVDGGSEAVAEGNRVFNSAIGGPYHDTWGSKDFVARDNYYSDVFIGPYQNLGLTSALKLGSSLTYQNVSGQWIATFTTYQAHGLQPFVNGVGDKVKIRGAVAFVTGVGNSYANPYNGDGPAPNYDGFPVLSTPTTTSFTYLLDNDPGMNAGGSPIFFKSTDPVKTGSVSNPQGLFALFDTGGTAHNFQVGDIVSVFGVELEGSIDNPYNGAFKIEAKTSTTFTYKLASTPAGTVGGTPSCAPATATPLVASGTTATFKTVYPHGFALGQGVRVQDVDPDATGLFVGNFKVETIPSSTSFTFLLSATPSDNARPGSLFAGLWQVGLHVIENNTIELSQPSPPGYDYGYADGIPAHAAPRDPQYTFRQVIVRDNLISNLHTSSTGVFYGITFVGAENAVVEGNLLALPQTNPLYHTFTKSIRYFCNQEPSGKLIQGTSGFGGPKVDEVATQVEDALALCL